MCVSNGRLATSGQCLPVVTYHTADNSILNWSGFSSVGCLRTLFILCVAYLQRCWHVLYKFAFRSLFINFAVSLDIRPVCQRTYSANSSCRHSFSDIRIISLLLNSLTKSVSKAIALFILQRVKLGTIYSGFIDSICPFVVHRTARRHNKRRVCCLI